MKDKYINGSLYYLDFRCVSVFVCVCVCVYVCVCVGGWWGWLKTFFPPCPQLGVTQSPNYQRSMRNLVPSGRNSVLN